MAKVLKSLVKSILPASAKISIPTGGSARSIAMAMLPAHVKAGYSASKVIATWKLRGLTYRRGTMLADYRDAANRLNFSPKVIDYVGSKKIPKSIMSETELKRNRRYRVFANVKYVDSETGRTTYKGVSFYDNTLRTKEGWGQEYIKQKQTAAYEEQLEVAEISITEVQHQKGWKY